MTEATRNLDVSSLPDHAFAHRSIAWWGTVGFMAVEGAFFAVLLATYLYGIPRAETWPPGVAPPPLVWGTVNLLLLLLNVVPNTIYKRAAERGDADRARRWILASVGLGFAFLAVRGLEFAALNVRWDHSFYGSIVWTLLAFHTVHVLSDTVETTVFAILSRRRPVRGQQLSDLADNAMYWFFVLGAWILVYAVIYLVPRFV